MEINRIWNFWPYPFEFPLSRNSCQQLLLIEPLFLSMKKKPPSACTTAKLNKWHDLGLQGWKDLSLSKATWMVVGLFCPHGFNSICVRN